MKSPLLFRPATLADASFVARHVLEALHLGMYELPLNAQQQQAWEELTAVCRLEEALYSYRHALLAIRDSMPVGLVLAYDGANYHTMRTQTFRLLPAFTRMDVDGMEDETGSGEFYIDSLAVAPHMRGQGLGKMLLNKAVERGERLGLLPTLLVDPDNAAARRLYTSAGFRENGSVTAFGQDYLRMQKIQSAHKDNPTS